MTGRFGAKDPPEVGCEGDAVGHVEIHAIQQVEDFLAAERILSEQTEKQKQAVASAQQFFDLEYDRYQTGIDPYIDVLTAQNTLLGDQQSLVNLQTQRMTSEIQLIIALGGGSVIDSAKVFAAANGDFEKVKTFLETQKGAERLSATSIIAVPTTAGTGSEVTCWGTVWDEVNGKKYSLARPHLYPTHAVIDPRLMLGKPLLLTISTGPAACARASQRAESLPVGREKRVFTDIFSSNRAGTAHCTSRRPEDIRVAVEFETRRKRANSRSQRRCARGGCQMSGRGKECTV